MISVNRTRSLTPRIANSKSSIDDLVAWMERGTVPDGDDVLGDVTKLGLRWTPTLHPDDPARRP